jgi:hypothetical protein
MTTDAIWPCLAGSSRRAGCYDNIRDITMRGSLLADGHGRAVEAVR